MQKVDFTYYKHTVRKGKIFLTVPAIMVLLLISCKKDDEVQNEIKGVITMTTTKLGYFDPLGVAGSGTITIEWGDGLPRTYQAPEGEMEGAFINYGGYAVDGQRRTITVTGNITGLLCPDNQLTDLDISRCKTLIYLSCATNQLTSLDVTNNTMLKFLFCQDNQLTNIDVSNNTALDFFHCQENQLINIYVWSGFDINNPPVGFRKDEMANYVVKNKE